MPTEKRTGARTPWSGKLEVNYVDAEGQRRFEIVEARDVSPGGCKILLQARCPARTVVQLRAASGTAGNGSVRYQRQTPRGYVTGIELLGGHTL